jgi:hypothetical protein
MADSSLDRLLDSDPRAQPAVQHVGPYRLLRPIGEGGMGVVHLGIAPDDTRVAVKVLRPHVVGDAEGRQRLAREIATMRRVRHPRVAPCLDGDPWGQVPYVVTRFVPGASLSEHVRDLGLLRGTQLQTFSRGLAEALAAVHRVGVLHRDVKPSNVLIDRGEPVLIDFGLAMSGDESRLTHAGWLLGTPAYLAPETVLGAEPGPPADVYGWAATVVFACTGHGPVGGGPTVAVLDRVRRGDLDLRSVPSELLPLVRDCLTGDPRVRPSAERVLQRLHAAPHGAGPTRPVTLLVPEQRAPGATPERPQHAAPPRPRMARAARWLTGAGWASALTAALATVPYVTSVLVLAAMIGVQAHGRTQAARWRRQDRRGVRRTDAARSVAGWPLHAVAAIPSATLTLLCGLLVGGLVVAVGSATGERPRDALVAGAALTVLAWWRGPWTRRYHRAGRRVLSRTAPPPHWRWALIWVLLVITVGALAVQHAFGPVWLPLPDSGWSPVR